jgi:DNA sulfur modification protein DndD
LNTAEQPVESVRLNMNGTIFQYGTATPPAQRAEQEAQVNKIIKANLPQELSRYFLFDAMEAGNLLKEDQLNRVIKENIENVMGFNKYMQLAKSSETLYQFQTSQRLQVENEKKEYLALLEEKKKKEEELNVTQTNLQQYLQYSVSNKEIYDNLKNGLNQETTINSKIEQTIAQIDLVKKKENLYRDEMDQFIKEIELNIFVPALIDAIRNEVNLILKVKQDKEISSATNVNPEQVQAIGGLILNYLDQQKMILGKIEIGTIVDYVIAQSMNTETIDDYDYLEYSDVNALEQLLTTKTINQFPSLNQNREELNKSIEQIPALNLQIEQMKAQVTGRDYSLLKAYEDNEQLIKLSENSIAEIKAEITKIDKKIHQWSLCWRKHANHWNHTLGYLEFIKIRR